MPDSTKESIARFFLTFGHIFKIFPFILAGFIYGNRLIIAKATIFIFYAMICNTLLKQIFKVPLYPHLGPGYSFPSGHMHAYGLFYGYFFLHSKSFILHSIFFFIFFGIATSLVYMRYHRQTDVLGSILVVFAELFIDQIIIEKYGEKKSVFFIVIICLICTFCLYLKMHEIQYHIWLAWYTMSGTILAFYAVQISNNQNFLQKSLALFVTLFGRWLIMKIWNSLDFDYYCLSEIPFLLLPLMTVAALKFSMMFDLPEIFVDQLKLQF